jgi:hypothetical protein
MIYYKRQMLKNRVANMVQLDNHPTPMPAGVVELIG